MMRGLDSPVATKESVFSLFTAQVTVNYVVDVFGANRRQLENMEALAEMQAFQREAVYLTCKSSDLIGRY